ncbi:MAG TPA: flagellar FliJ family protein [Candidatus Binatia bacterium]|nr:flagellar FliJ family protein [Candidatus Binatia bacterium]
MAPRFRFALQPLLDRRSRIEEEKQHRFDLRRCERDGALYEGEQLAAALIQRALRTSDAGSLAVFDAAIAARRQRAEWVERALATARHELMAARRDRRAIEKLRDRRRHAFEEEEARREELEIDEANARRRPP